MRPEDTVENSTDDITIRVKSSATKRKGRGFSSAQDRDSSMEVDQEFDKVEESNVSGKAQKSVEGWVVFVTGIHEEATEEDIHDQFSEFGSIKNFVMDLDHRTGFVKGYALIEYESFGEGKSAIDNMNGAKILGSEVSCDFAFVKKPLPVPEGRKWNYRE